MADQQAGPIPDLVGRDFTADAPGAKMVGDITQVDTGEGPLFVATVIDCFSKAVIGWATNGRYPAVPGGTRRYPASLVCSAIDMAVLRIGLPAGAVFHSDRGGQYTSRQFAVTLAGHGSPNPSGVTDML